FMGNEFAATTEWNYKTELPWDLLQYEPHRKMKDCVKELCFLYREEPALYELQFSPDGFEWTDLNHREESVMAFRRKGKDPANDQVIICNMTQVVRWNWKLQLKGKATWKEVFSSDAKQFWGTGHVYNPGPEISLLDKKENLIEINIH